MAVRVVTVVGARPQFVKAAVVASALATRGVRETIIHTGQHSDAAMSDVFFRQLDLPPPAHHLGIGGLPHGAMTGRMIAALEERLSGDRPDWVLVYGDTNSTLAAALAAVKLGVPVAHVEAGMRSFNRAMPEEINRVVTDHVASRHFVTGGGPAAWLAAEGIRDSVIVAGDVMYDAAVRYRDAAAAGGFRAGLGLTAGSYALATLHRQENTDDPARLAALWQGLARVAARLPVVLPLHPRTHKLLAARELPAGAPGLRVLPPIGYLEMLDLEAGAALVLTDSGGVQREAYFSGVPCVTLRDETEWPETVALGWNALAGADPVAVDAAAAVALADAADSARGRARRPRPPIFGDGHAADRIATSLAEVAP